MRTRRLLFAGIVAVILAVTVARATAGYCFPLCPLYNVWDPQYWLFGCDACPKNPPDAG